MTCGACKHWTLAGRMGELGYGQCAARPEALRAAMTTSAQAQCRIGRFEAAAPVQPGALL